MEIEIPVLVTLTKEEFKKLDRDAFNKSKITTTLPISMSEYELIKEFIEINYMDSIEFTIYIPICWIAGQNCLDIHINNLLKGVYK